VLIKIIAVQSRMGQKLSLSEKIHIFKERPDFVCLPEYSLMDKSIADYHRAALLYRDHLDYLIHLSDELRTCLIAGTIVEPEESRLYNSCFVINRGLVLGRYRKRYPVAGEQRKGISAGDRNLVLEVNGVRLGLMVCGDVFFPHMYGELGEAETDLIFVPTTSAYRPDDTISRKKDRDNTYFQSGAGTAGAYVIKVCSVGRIFDTELHGRSLIAAPWGILRRVEFASESHPRILAEILDITELREFRRKLRQRPLVTRTAEDQTSRTK